MHHEATLDLTALNRLLVLIRQLMLRILAARRLTLVTVGTLRIQRPASGGTCALAATASVAHLLRVGVDTERIQVDLLLLRAL